MVEFYSKNYTADKITVVVVGDINAEKTALEVAKAFEKMPRGDYVAAAYWNGAAFRARLAKPSIRFGYPREGFPVWMDSVVELKTAKNVENAKLFMNFVMEPENAALISSFARCANGITGSEKYMPEDMKTAVEIVVPDEFKDAGVFVPACSKEANDYYTAIWTELTKKYSGPNRYGYGKFMNDRRIWLPDPLFLYF